MNDDSGWIKLYRKIQHNPLWTEKRKFSRAEAWIDMLLEARHDPEPHRMLIGNMEIICNRGECIKSLDSWAKRWGWNKSAVRRFFDLLQRMNQIRHANETQTSRVTICNFDTYNGERNANETQMKRKRNACETHVTPNKNDKNEKNDKNTYTKGVQGDEDVAAATECSKPYTRWTQEEFDAEANRVHEEKHILTDDVMGNRFCLYWTERDAKGKMRFQKQTTWDMMRRMVTWRDRSNGGN